MGNGIKILPYCSLNLNTLLPRRDFSVSYKGTERGFGFFVFVLLCNICSLSCKPIEDTGSFSDLCELTTCAKSTPCSCLSGQKSSLFA